MPSAQNPNLRILELAVEQLGELSERMVFLGGCATGLLITDAAAPPIRVTRDVDVITQVGSLVDYYHLAELLREKGFREDERPGVPICRWVCAEVVLDVMPTNEEILGFANEWYAPAINTANPVTLPSGRLIRMVTAPYFLATKLVAFDARGQEDFLMSHDMEDIVVVIDGRPEISNEVQKAEETLRHYLLTRFTELLLNQNFRSALPGHLQGGAGGAGRAPIVERRIQSMMNTE